MVPRLLVVDDEPEVLKLVKGLLESFGCEVCGIGNSREAAQLLNREKFDAVFLDARMPHPDGLELTRYIRESPSNSRVPIVMLTGYDDAETMRTGFKAGVTFFLGKPLDMRKLQGLLKALRGVMLKERRRYTRLPLRTVVTCRVGKHQFKSNSLNISEAGMLLEGTGGIDQGQEVELRFSLPRGPEQLNPRSRVVRKEPRDRMGVQFLELKPEDLKALRGFVAGVIKE